MADPAYGPWSLVVLNTAPHVVFTASFFHPRPRAGLAGALAQPIDDLTRPRGRRPGRP
jgi:hypothetical protein